MISERRFALIDQQVFAEASGDFNPIHTDPIAARRLPFGEPIVHGIHLVLWGLEQILADQLVEASGLEIVRLRANFKIPVKLGMTVKLVETRPEMDAQGFDILLYDKRAVSCLFEIQRVGISSGFLPPTKEDRLCKELAFEDLTHCQGEFDLRMHHVKVGSLFPTLSKYLHFSHLATILTCSRLVGMECPGMHSLFSDLELKRRDEYQNFWDSFGRVVKEGIYEDAENRAKILEVSFFKSAKSATMLTLDEYIDAFAEGQEEIYYLSVEDPALATGSPHLEGFEAKGVDVLILSDPVDDFWLANTPDYKGKTFRSISRGDVDLTAIKSADGEDTDDDHKDKNETKSADTAVAKIKDILSTRVADVKPSKNLAKSVARLIADENAMDAQMERFMRMHNSDFKGAPKILEVNAKHPLIDIVLAKQSQIHKALVLSYFFQYFDTNYHHQPQCLLMMLIKRLKLLKKVKKTYFYKYQFSLKEAFDWLKN